MRCVVYDRICLSLNKSKRKQNPYTMKNLDLLTPTKKLEYANYLTSVIDSIETYNLHFSSLYRLFNTCDINILESMYCKILGVECISEYKFN